MQKRFRQQDRKVLQQNIQTKYWDSMVHYMIIQKLELGLFEPSNRVINGLNGLTSGETYDTNIFQQLHLHASMNLKRKVQLMVHSK